MKEIWKPIKGYEGLYEVSNLGNVKSIARTVKNGGRVRHLNECIIGHVMGGFASVRLRKNNTSKNISIHRLVAETFIENPNNYKFVIHIDKNPSNNRADNLEWVERTRMRKVIRIDSDGNEKEYKSLIDAEKEGFNKRCIIDCCQGIIRIHRGFKWRYADE